MTLDATATMAAARLLAANKTPYFSMALVKLVPIARAGLGTMGVTKDWLLLYDPDAVVRWGAAQTAGVLAHELQHLLRQHHRRALDSDPRASNIAKDLAINPDVVAMGYRLPDGGVMPRQFGLPDGLTAEDYLARLSKQAESDKGGKNVDDETIPGKVGPCAGWCGSGAGNPLPDEPDGASEGGRSEAEGQAIAKATAEAVRAYAENGKGRGNLPAGLMRWAAEILTPPKVRWQDKFARVCRTAVAYRPGYGEVTYHAYSRRQAGIGYGIGHAILPAYRQRVPRVDVLIDTSGSMGSEQLAVAVSECSGILKQVGARVRLICCDAAVETFEYIHDARDILRKLKGGGGTDFTPAFRRIATSEDRPEMLIALTDGDATVPDLPPRDLTVIWCVIDGSRAPAEWGERININTRDAI